MIRSPGGEPDPCCDGRLTALSRPPFRLPRFVCVMPRCWAVFFVAGVLSSSSQAKPADFATADLEPFTPPPAEMQLSPAGARRAEALALFYKGRRLEQGVDEDLALEAYQQAMKLEQENVSLASRMARPSAQAPKGATPLHPLTCQGPLPPVSQRSFASLCLASGRGPSGSVTGGFAPPNPRGISLEGDLDRRTIDGLAGPAVRLSGPRLLRRRCAAPRRFGNRMRCPARPQAPGPNRSRGFP